MLAEQRHQYILAQVAKTGALSVAELVRELNVSRETIRRDLNALAGRGLLVTTHGGALSSDRREPDLDTREAANAGAKRAIGERAAEFVPDGASLIIDSGSTTQAVARALLDRHRLSVYTNDWRIALLLGRRNDNRVTLLGGELSDIEDATFGLDTVHQLTQYHADFAFIGAGGSGLACDLHRPSGLRKTSHTVGDGLLQTVKNGSQLRIVCRLLEREIAVGTEQFKRRDFDAPLANRL